MEPYVTWEPAFDQPLVLKLVLAYVDKVVLRALCIGRITTRMEEKDHEECEETAASCSCRVSAGPSQISASSVTVGEIIYLNVLNN